MMQKLSIMIFKWFVHTYDSCVNVCLKAVFFNAAPMCSEKGSDPVHAQAMFVVKHTFSLRAKTIYALTGKGYFRKQLSWTR